MAKTDRTRKLIVRSALATSTTIATLIGAQNFALLDSNQFLPDNGVIALPAATRTPVPVARSAPEITILHTAPSITILRQSGQVNTTGTTSASQSATVNKTVIQPPAPSQIAAPQPVIVQRPIFQRSHSSR